MSKSLGNGIDPLDVVERYGADALRWTMTQGMGLGVDVMLDPNDLEKSFAPGRNFATKLWNIGRFLLMQVGVDPVQRLDALDRGSFRHVDHWILNRLAAAVHACDAALGPSRPGDAKRWAASQLNSGLRLDEYAESARRFLWNELADWYVEATKTRLQTPGPDREIARALLVHSFDQGLRLLHPIMPFITETLWRKLPTHEVGTFLARASWPTVAGRAPNEGTSFELVRETITAIRQLRADYAIPAGEMLQAHVTGPPALEQRLVAEAAFVGRMARCELHRGAPPAGVAAHAVLPSGVEVVLPLAGVVDLGKECARLKGEVASLEKQLAALRGRLENEKFVAKAPPEIVELERAKQREWSVRRDQLQAKVRSLCGD
jgi:valyl-tRNA synthetase